MYFDHIYPPLPSSNSPTLLHLLPSSCRVYFPFLLDPLSSVSAAHIHMDMGPPTMGQALKRKRTFLSPSAISCQ